MGNVLQTLFKKKKAVDMPSSSQLTLVTDYVTESMVPVAKGTKCVDGRYLPDQGTGMIARPGGDGGYVMALEGVNRMRGLDLSPEQCFNAVFNAVKKLNGTFYLHTDRHTDPNAKTHHGLIGCGHLAKAARRGFSWQYDVRSKDVKEMVNYARNLCEISDEVKMINLAGEHQEKGVFLIHSDTYTVSADNPKLHQMYFVYDVDRDRAFMKELVEEMHIPGLTVKDMQREADLQLDATLQNLALGLPMYEVAFEGRTPQVTYLGHITQKSFLQRFHVPFATPLFLKK